MSMFEDGIVAVIIGLTAVLGYAIFVDINRPEILLKKDDWKCTKTEARVFL